LTEDVAAVRSEIVRVARLLRERGLAVGTSGNVGARLDDGRIAITPSTMDYDEMTAENTPKLKLNTEDNDFFLANILVAPGERKPVPATSASHNRLLHAAAIAKVHVENIVSPFGKADKAKELYRWVKFLRETAMVIAIRVPDYLNAYTMFETLNDRGLRASQTDILKNFLFGRAQDRLPEVQIKWSSVVATIGSTT